LNELSERLGVPPDRQVWVTFDNALSRSLLAGRDVRFVPFTSPRDGLNIVRTRIIAERMISSKHFDTVVSTGASPAVAFLPVAARRGIRSVYIESAARAVGPSLSGKILARNARVRTYTQYPSWADARWQYRGSIFDAFESVPDPGERKGALRSAVVTVGTQEGYRFDRLFEALVPLMSEFDDVLWQTGPQDVAAFGIDGRPTVPHDELRAKVAAADVVVSHSGTGSAITALESGKCPILVPRLARFREHVDDHQVQIARELDVRGLAIMRHAHALRPDDLVEAASRTVRRVRPPRIVLE
jgi:UDP-N-acetylglucosamine transferase subunit ALG13